MLSSPQHKSSEVKTVGDVATTVAGALKVLRDHGINWSSMREVPVGEAASMCGVDAETLQRELAALRVKPAGLPENSTELVDYIISRYHEVHRRELVELLGLARRVETVHGGHPKAPIGLAEILERVQADLESHMIKEERILFPSICSGFRGSLFGPIVVMRHEHDDHAKLIFAIYLVTSGLNLPADACNSWKTLYAGLEKLTTDLIEHINIENDVLFPRFMAAR